MSEGNGSKDLQSGPMIRNQTKVGQMVCWGSGVGAGWLGVAGSWGDLVGWLGPGLGGACVG